MTATREYIDTQIVDCSRITATIKNDSQPAEWVNNLNDTIELLPGDKVSMYSSFISERGAGQANSVELRGETLGTKKLIYTKQIQDNRKNLAFEMNIRNYFQRIPDQPYTAEYQNVEEEIPVRDNEINMVISYYKTMDLNSYVQMPRRFIPDFSDLGDNGGNRTPALSAEETTWSVFDSATYGAVNKTPISLDYNVVVPGGFENYDADINTSFGYVVDDYKPIYSVIAEEGSSGTDGRINGKLRQPINNWCLKNDGTRYTIMIRTKTQFSIENKFIEKKVGTMSENETFIDFDPNFTAPYYARDPEYFDYVQYKKKITLNLDKGFNASSFIAEELTKQLGETNLNSTDTISNSLGSFSRNPSLASHYETQIEYPISQSAESQTYNTFPTTSDKSNNKYRYFNVAQNREGPLAPDGSALYDIDDPTTWWTKLVASGTTQVVDDLSQSASNAYYQSLEYIACKRPEIYETGSKLNDIFGISHERANRLNAPDEASFQSVANGGLVLSMDYTQANCKLIKDFVEAQAKYPELFSQKNIITMYRDDGTNNDAGTTTAGETTNPYYKITRTVNDNRSVADDPPFASYTENIVMNANVNNSRFFHMNSNTGIHTNHVIRQDTDNYSFLFPETFAQLGCSYYDFYGTSGTGVIGAGATDYNTAVNTKRHSLPFLVHYDPTQSETFYESPQSNTDGGEFDDEADRIGKFTYGCIGRFDYTVLGINYSKIVLFPNKILRTDGITGCGLPTELFIGGVIEYNRKLGFDRHWNAWSTAMIALTSGIPSLSKFRNEFYEGDIGAGLADPNAAVPTTTGRGNLTNMSIPLSKMYLGADKMTIGFDGQHFFFSDLHTALNKGNLTNSELGGQADEGGFIVYKINPEQHYNNYSPVQFPYEQPQEMNYAAEAAGAEKRNITRVNQNISAWAVYDTSTGVFIEDFGYDETTWEECLWKKLGFSYEQLHDINNNRFTRYSNSPALVSKPTTNAKIDARDTKEWAQNQFFDATYDGSLTHSKTIILKTGEAAADKYQFRMLPQITITTSSINIVATDYPITSFKGFYTIRSDIISDNKYSGHAGDTAMDVIGITDKIYPVNDFITGTASPIEFTITAPRILASVKTAITDPDGKYAIVNDNSSILYKIQRFRRLHLNIAEEIREKLVEENK